MVMAKTVTPTDDGSLDFLPMMIIGIFMFAMVLSTVVMPINQAAQAQAYLGRTVPKTVKSDSALKYLDTRQDYPYTFWISAYFINDGPDPVEMAINYPDDKFTIKPNETITVNRSGAQERIAVIFYQCERGRTATVRITGEY